MAFPGPYSKIYRNEAGEVIGWDNPSEYEPEDDFEEQERQYQRLTCEECGLHPEDCECDYDEEGE